MATQTFWHTPHAIRRSKMFTLERWFRDHFDVTINQPFRAPEGIVTEWLYNYVELLEGWSMVGTLGYSYHQVGSCNALQRLDGLLAHRRADVICLNDSGNIDLTGDEIAVHLETFLERFLPVPSSFERPPIPERAS